MLVEAINDYATLPETKVSIALIDIQTTLFIVNSIAFLFTGPATYDVEDRKNKADRDAVVNVLNALTAAISRSTEETKKSRALSPVAPASNGGQSVPQVSSVESENSPDTA